MENIRAYKAMVRGVDLDRDMTSFERVLAVAHAKATTYTPIDRTRYVVAGVGECISTVEHDALVRVERWVERVNRPAPRIDAPIECDIPTFIELWHEVTAEILASPDAVVA